MIFLLTFRVCMIFLCRQSAGILILNFKETGSGKQRAPVYSIFARCLFFQ